MTNVSRPPHDPYAAFRIRNFRLYTAGSLVVLIGTRIQAVAIVWEIYQRTGEPLALGLVGLVQAVPMLGLALPAGHLADVLDRRNLELLSMGGTSLTSVGLAGLSFAQGSIVLMFILLLLDSAFLTLGRPARMALLPMLVPTAVFPNAVTWRTSMFQVASVLGPAAGGFVVALHVQIGRAHV